MHWFFLIVSILLILVIKAGLFLKYQLLISASTVTFILFIFQSLMLFLIVLWLKETSEKLSVLKNINKKIKTPDAQTDER